MADFKQIQVRIWQDNWFLSLKPEEKLFWFFLLTNEYSHISGFYELPKPLISPLTGIKDWENILIKFAKDGKINCYEGWIYILNKRKHQPISNNIKDNVNISIEKYIKENEAIFTQISKPLQSPFKAPYKPLPEIEREIEIEIEIERERGDKSPTPKEISKNFFTSLETQEKFLLDLSERGLEENIVRLEISKFISYWTEPNPSGTKLRWEMEKTFEIGRRLKNWFNKINNQNTYNKQSTIINLDKL